MSASEGRGAPARSCTTAATWLPHLVSGTPATSASYTSGCALSACSTSSAYTFSPPVLMHCEPRPRTVTTPSASTVAMSPSSTQRRPSLSKNVSAVFTGSL